jgi:hypothetical protein
MRQCALGIGVRLTAKDYLVVVIDCEVVVAARRALYSVVVTATNCGSSARAASSWPG